MRVKQLEVLGGKLGQHLSFGGFLVSQADVGEGWSFGVML